VPGDITDVQIMNFLRHGFQKLLSDRDRQTESTEIINHAASQVVNKALYRGKISLCNPVCHTFSIT